MIQIIVFSFNRALQLNTLLTSIAACWKSPAYHIDVIYNTSDQTYQDGYERLIKECADMPVTFHREEAGHSRFPLRALSHSANIKHYLKYPYVRKPKTNFRQLLIKTVSSRHAPFVMMMTDDAMLIDEVKVPDSVLSWIADSPMQRQFSLRIGAGMDRQPTGIVHETNGLLHWNMSEAPANTNWGYPFSVDAHIYHHDLIMRLLKEIVFVNPNTLEAFVCHEMRKRRLGQQACAFSKTRLLSFPINMVQTVANNESLGIDCRELNQLYLQGITMRYPIPSTITRFQVYPDHLLLYENGIERPMHFAAGTTDL